MSIKIDYADGTELLVTDISTYSINIDSTPLDSADSSGSVGTFSVTFPRPWDRMNDLNIHSPLILEGKAIEFESEYGKVNGVIDEVEIVDRNFLSVSCTSYAGALNSYRVQANPVFRNGGTNATTGPGTLKQAIDYYFTLATTTVTAQVNPAIANRPVVYPGWTGELWYHLKLLCAAEKIQFSLQEKGVVGVEPARQAGLPFLEASSESEKVDSSSLAQSIEVYEYNCQAVRNELFYPAGGWSEDVQILTVNAGEYAEQTIELGGSLLTFSNPVMQTFVSKEHQNSSVYTVVGDDGFPIQPAQWSAAGGEVLFEIGEDSNTINVKMRGATDIRMSDGQTSTSFSLALAADSSSGSRYSTLRIVGTGVQYEKEILTVATGIPEGTTGSEVGVTIDNPFLFDRNRVGSAATIASAANSGAVLKVDISTTELGTGFTVDDTGARFEIDGRRYRLRNVTYSPTGISASADADTLYHDYDAPTLGLSYGVIQNLSAGLSYRDVILRGVRLFDEQWAVVPAG